MGNGKNPIENANYPALRQLVAPQSEPWLVCTPDSTPWFKKVCFFFVQLPNIGKSDAANPAGGDGRAEIRNAQMQALALPNTRMSVAIDVGAEREHPPNNLDTGVRLVRLALHRDYGKTALVPCGPLYKGFKIEGSRIRVEFDYAQHGLMLASKDGAAAPVPTPDARMPWLSIQANDGTWHWAEGTIDGADLLGSCQDVKEPIALRYACTQNPLVCNLYNTDGLPASPFSTCGY